jgi:hypothetical protein
MDPGVFRRTLFAEVFSRQLRRKFSAESGFSLILSVC